MSAAQIVGMALHLARRFPGLFGGLALLGAAPLCVAILALFHVAIVRAGERSGVSDAVLLLSFLVAVALFARGFFHAAILRALSAVLGGSAAGPGRYLAEAARGWLPAVLTGGTVSFLGIVSGFFLFVPVVLLGGLFLQAMPRVVLDGVSPWQALAPARATGRGGKSLLVNLLLFVVAAGLFVNLHFLVQLVLALGRIFLNLETSYLSAVLSFDNPVFVLVLACVSLVLVEPVRVISAGLLHLEKKVRREGLDLAPRIEELRSAPRRMPGVLGVAIVAFALLAGSPARAAPSADVHEAQAALAADLAGKEGGLARLQALLGEVLAQSEYRDLDPSLWKRPQAGPPPPTPEDLEDLLAGPSQTPSGISGFTVLAVLLAVAGVGVGIALALLGWRSRRRTPPAPTPAEPARTEAALGLDALAREPGDWRAEAEALAARGEYREALRRIYLAVLVALHRRRAIEYERHRTNWEYLRGFRGAAAAKAVFRALTQAFDFAWYGRRPLDGAAYGQFAARAAELLAEPETTTAEGR
jgi:hypothetical protein